MKKSLIASFVLLGSGAAMAQSSVTLYGVVDVNLAVGNGSVLNKTQVSSGGNAPSRIGFRGTEDLGGGLTARFVLEAGVNADDGTGQATNTNNQNSGATTGGGLAFNRLSTIGLSGQFGEVRIGRDYTPQYWNHLLFDPFLNSGVGASQTMKNIGGPINTRASNSVGYSLPGNLGGFYGQIQHYFGENVTGTPTSGDGTGSGLRVGYASGPVNVAAATSQTSYLAPGTIKTTNLGGSYDFGVAKISAMYDQDKITGGTTGKGWLLGLSAPVGVGEIRAAYSTYIGTLVSNDPRTNKVSLGYVHNLSKRTALYTTVAHLSNESGGALALNGAVTGVNASSTGFDLGIRHSF